MMNIQEEKLLKHLEWGVDKQLYNKAEKILNDDAINPREFADLYDKDTIADDLRYVRKRERQFLEQNTPEQIESKKLASIFEAIIHEQSELNYWLGPNTIMIKASRYDDIKNGIDTIAEFTEEKRSPSHIGLAIDATFSAEIEKKVKNIKEQITKGSLAKIKYFKSKNFRGELSQIPKVIITADIKTIHELAKLWKQRKNKELLEHPIQFQILDQILIQLETYKEYAEKQSQPEIVEIYNKMLDIIMEIYNERTSAVKDTGARDSMFDKIKNIMDEF